MKARMSCCWRGIELKESSGFKIGIFDQIQAVFIAETLIFPSVSKRCIKIMLQLLDRARGFGILELSIANCIQPIDYNEGE